MSKEALTTIQTGQLQGRALLDKNTFNKEDRTIEVVFATETPVKMYNWRTGEWFWEILEISESAINFERFGTGRANVLDTHYSYQLKNIIGVVRKAWIDPSTKEARALVQLSSRDDIEGIIRDIQEGITSNISVGYSVQEYLVSETDSDLPTYRATKWTPAELSFVPIPADHNSGSRSQEEATITTTIIKKSNIKMEEQNPTQERGAENPNPAPATAPTAPANPPVNEAEIARKAVEAERKRQTDIEALCSSVGLSDEFTRSLINEGISVDTARQRAIDEIAKNQPKAPTVTGGIDELSQTQRSIELGIAFRSNPGGVDLKGNEKARRYANMRLLDIAKELLRSKGENYDMLSEMDIVKRAYSTTDFPNLLSNSFKYNFLGYYNALPQDWKFLGSRKSASDFRRKDNLALDGAVTFEEVSEGGEYKSSDFLYEENHSIQLRTYGRMFNITRQAIINDEIGIFNDLPKMFAIGSEAFQAKKVWDLIIKNEKTSDGKNLFHADHKNLITPGTALSIESLGVARALMARQVSPKGDLELNLEPAILVVPPELRTLAEQLAASIMANETGKVNVFAGKIKVIVSAKLKSPKEWYLVADTSSAVIDGIVYAYLNGSEGVQLDSEIDFSTGNMRIKGSLDFDAKVWNPHTLLKNVGA